MKKIINFLFALLLPLCLVKANEVKTVSVAYDIDDFSLTYDAAGALEISSYKHTVGYDSDTSKPGLPLTSVNVLLPTGTEYSSVSATSTKTLVAENVVLAANPMPVLPGATVKTMQLSADEPVVSTDVSSLRSGIHVVSLFVDGQLVDSCRMIKE